MLLVVLMVLLGDKKLGSLGSWSICITGFNMGLRQYGIVTSYHFELFSLRGQYHK